MSGVEDRDAGTRHHQANQASGGSSIYANQGGRQSISHNYNTTVNARNRKWTGWAILVVLALDVVFFIYGREAYTGMSGNSGDLWRAGIFLVLMGITGALIRRWFRNKI